MKRPFAIIGFSFGVTLIVLNSAGIEFAKYTLIAAVAAFLISVVIPDLRRGEAVPTCAFSAVLACTIFIIAYYGSVLPQLSLDGKSADALFCVTGLGEERNGKYIYDAKAVSVFLNGAPQGIKVKLYSAKPINAEGYRLLRGKLYFTSCGDSGFSSYGMWGKNIFLRASVNEYVVTPDYIRTPMRKILELRQEIINSFSNKVGKDEGALAIGMLIGDRSHMSDRLNAAFKTAGATHLTAVSGLHLSAVTGVFVFIFDRFRISKKLSTPIIVAVIIFYCMLSGFSKSVVRAGIMMTVLLVGRMFKERADALNSLGIALFIICFNPFAVSDISTLLTTVSVIAIVSITPKVARWRDETKLFKKLYSKMSKTRERRLKRFQNLFLVSFIITLCNLPIMCVFFGYFSAIGILLNVIIVPLGSAAIAVSMLASIFINIPFAAGLFAFAVRVLNGAIIRLVLAAAAIPFAAVNIGHVMAVALGISLIIISVAVYLSLPKAASIVASAVTVIILTALACSMYFSSLSHIYISEPGAAVIKNRGSVTIINVNDNYGYSEVSRYLQSHGIKPDSLVNCKSEYANKICSTFDVKCDIIQTDTYSTAVDGVTFACGENANANIVLKDEAVYTSSGASDLTEGELEYIIDGGSYVADRYYSSILT